MDMDVERIDRSCFKTFFSNTLRDLPFLTPEVCTERLRKFMDMLQMHMDNHYRSGQLPAIGRPDAESEACSHTR